MTRPHIMQSMHQVHPAGGGFAAGFLRAGGAGCPDRGCGYPYSRHSKPLLERLELSLSFATFGGIICSSSVITVMNLWCVDAPSSLLHPHPSGHRENQG